MLFGKLIIFTFVACCVLGLFSVLWVIVFSIKIIFELSDSKDAFSRRTLWNPLNAIFSPSLLSESGIKSRANIFRGLVVFSAALLGAACIAGLVGLTN
jgi:hypothetical protein